LLCGFLVLVLLSKMALLLGVFVIAIAKLYQSYRWRSAWSIVLSSLIVPVMA
jgi:hypothetical protein